MALLASTNNHRDELVPRVIRSKAPCGPHHRRGLLLPASGEGLEDLPSHPGSIAPRLRRRMLFDEFRGEIMTSLRVRQVQKRARMKLFAGKPNNVNVIVSLLIC
jgi:hypothetical protein